MDEFKPEDDLRPDPYDRPGRSRKSAGNNEPQIDFAALDVERDDPRPTRSRRTRDDYDVNEKSVLEDDVRHPRRRRASEAPNKGPIFRQHMMMALGILVLLLLIFGIGSALDAPSTDGSANRGGQSQERSVQLPMTGDNNSVTNRGTGAPSEPQVISVPPVAATPTEGQPLAVPDNQRRVEVQGDLNNALMPPQAPVDSASVASTLPTQPATVAAVRGSNGSTAGVSRPVTRVEKQPQHQTAAPQAPTSQRQRATIDMPPRKVTAQASTPSRTSEPKTTAANTAAVRTASSATTAPKTSAAVAAPKASAAASAGATTGNISALTSAPGSSYTLQLSSSSNCNNLNAWAKKESLSHYVVYKTTRNGQPWYVLVSGVYGNKDEARRAVSALPADVQAKNPWAKPIHQVQADLKQ